jgi:hypothetical protein
VAVHSGARCAYLRKTDQFWQLLLPAIFAHVAIDLSQRVTHWDTKRSKAFVLRVVVAKRASWALSSEPGLRGISSRRELLAESYLL